ncbi:hypothetical protein D3C86_1889820 [compost metagenome]
MTKYKVGISHAASKLIFDTDTYAVIVWPQVGVEAFNAVIASITPLFANTDLAKW